MKKILFVTNNLVSGGVENALIQITNHLCDTYDITIYVIFRCSNILLEPLDSRIKVKCLLNFYFRGLSRMLRNLPIRIVDKLLIGDTSQFDLIIAFQFGLPTELLSVHKQNKLAWMHGYDEKSIEYHKKYNEVVFISKEVMDTFINKFPYFKKNVLAYNIINVPDIIAKSNEYFEKSNDKIRFVTVGRLDKLKGIDRIIKAFNKLKEENFDFEFLIVGDGDQFDYLHQIIDQYNLNNQIKLLGLQQNPYKIIKNSDCYICASFSEGLSISVTESIILDVPVITTNVFGMNELLQKDIGGWIVNSDDELFSQIREVLLDSKILCDKSDEMRVLLNDYNIDNRVKKIKKIIDRNIT